MAFPGNLAWKCSFYGRKSIAEATFLLLLGPAKPVLRIVDERAKPFHTFLGDVDSLRKAYFAFRIVIFLFFISLASIPYFSELVQTKTRIHLTGIEQIKRTEYR